MIIHRSIPLTFMKRKIELVVHGLQEGVCFSLSVKVRQKVRNCEHHGSYVQKETNI